ncbi:phosphatase [Actinoplanes sp. SE50]|uniref:SpoIIE family protein phosphatase n=1 Tax=unclassified Actinoplanes TaxID=2626549 RepID=UPI00023ED577|nr:MULTISPECIES: SpoIIE family protein phosphatase [unclassified Actinoplanes]AEV82267.1 multi-sensor signal transduction histidine kinase [Actinoplanes sp. SE50/110]ATO80664.1 phosphatase [Actinoplanes sp. SE50]SLL98071.1 phosphatase [Actinoplanes sp. SE50/110]
MSESGGPDVTQELRLPWDDDPEDLYEHAPCGYLTTLPDGTVVRVNETFLSWTGYTRAELIGHRRFRDLLAPGCRIYHETHYAPLLTMQSEVHEIALDVLCADGSRVPVLVNSVLERGVGGAPRVIRTMVFNATERRSYETELLLARDVAESSEQRIKALQRIVADLAAAPTEAEVAEAVVRAPEGAFQATSSSIYLVDQDRDQLVAVASTDPTTGNWNDMPRSSQRAVAEVARRGDLHVVHTLAEAAEHFPDLAESMVRSGRSTVVLLPLTTGPAEDHAGVTVLGLLAFSFAEERRLSDGELRVIRLLGQQAGQALDRARLYDDARRREERADFLAVTTRALDEEHRLMQRSRRLVERVVPAIADWATVRLHVGPVGLREDAGGPAPDEARLGARILEATRSVKPIFATEGDPLDCAVLPLTARGRVLGTLALRMAETRHAPETDQAFLIDLADRAGLALENARLYEQERAVARTLQRSLLAADVPSGDPRFALETHYRAAGHDLEVGGDWFDAFLITPHKLAVVVGDVVGRGLEAASTMGQLRSAIRALATAENGPARLLEGLDRFCQRVETARMATVVYGEIDLDACELVYACAGHLPPLLHQPAGPAEFLLQARSGPIGTRAGDRRRTETRIRLAPGSRLLLYTDGLIERRDRPIDHGFEVLNREFSRLRGAPMKGLTMALTDTLAGREHGDDVCLLCLTLGVEERLERTLGADPLQISLLRSDLRSWLASHGVDRECLNAVLLACSEAVGNAIEHGYRDDPFGTVEVSVTITDDAVEIRVADRGTWRGPGHSRGRGLQLIEECMDEMLFDQGEGGTTVTMRRYRGDAA